MKHNHGEGIETSTDLEITNMHGIVNERELCKEKRKKMKRVRLRNQYIKRGMLFLESFDRLEHNLKTEILSNQIDQFISICYVFGTSLANPKEIYRIHLPTGNIIMFNAGIEGYSNIYYPY